MINNQIITTDWKSLNPLTKEKNANGYELDKLLEKRKIVEGNIKRGIAEQRILSKLKDLDSQFFKFKGILSEKKWESETVNQKYIEEQKKQKNEIDQLIPIVEKKIEELTQKINVERERINEESKIAPSLDPSDENKVIEISKTIFDNKDFVSSLGVILLANYLMIHPGIQKVMIDTLKKPTKEDIETIINNKIIIPKPIIWEIINKYCGSAEDIELKKVAIIDTNTLTTTKSNFEEFQIFSDPKNPQIVSSMCFSVHKSILATGHEYRHSAKQFKNEGIIKIWKFKGHNTRFIKQLKSPEEEFNQVRMLSLSPDGKFLAAALHRYNKYLPYLFVIWDVENGECLKSESRNSLISCIRFDPIKDRLIFTQSRFAHLYEYSNNEWSYVKDIVDDHYSSDIGTINFSSNGEQLIVANQSSIKLMDTTEFKVKDTIEESVASNNGVGFSADNSCLLYMNSDPGYVALYDIKQQKEIKKFRGYLGKDYAASSRFAINPSCNYFIAGHKSSFFFIVNFDSDKNKRITEEFLMSDQTEGFSNLCFSPDGNYLVWGLDQYLAIAKLVSSLPSSLKQLSSQNLIEFLYEQAKEDYKIMSPDEIKNFIKNKNMNKKIFVDDEKSDVEEESIKKSDDIEHYPIHKNIKSDDKTVIEKVEKEFDEDTAKTLHIPKIWKKDYNKSLDEKQKEYYDIFDIDRTGLERRLDIEEYKIYRRALPITISQEERKLPVNNLNQMLKKRLKAEIQSDKKLSKTLSWRERFAEKFGQWKNRIWNTFRPVKN